MRRFWIREVNNRVEIARAEPFDLNRATLRVRHADPVGTSDGIWVNGQRSPDTWVLKNGVVVFHSHPAGPQTSAAFDRLEALGGGQALN